MLIDFVREWGIDNPIDYWWRKKNKVPFNSTLHRSISQRDMLFEFLEEELVREQEQEQICKSQESEYEYGSFDFLIDRVIDSSEIDMSKVEWDKIEL